MVYGGYNFSYWGAIAFSYLKKAAELTMVYGGYNFSYWGATILYL